MAKRNKFFKQQALPLAEQLRQMKIHWPGYTRSMHRSGVSWTGQLTPTGMSDTYTIRVTYTPPRRPVVEVISPVLKERPGKRIKHTFPGNKLCLHLHEEWTANTIIATTVIKWAALWLFFYETWLITGEWEGGGHEPPTKKA